MYETWQGNNKFFFNGRVMTTSDFPYFVLSHTIILVLSGVFFNFVFLPQYKEVHFYCMIRISISIYGCAPFEVSCVICCAAPGAAVR